MGYTAGGRLELTHQNSSNISLGLSEYTSQTTMRIGKGTQYTSDPEVTQSPQATLSLHLSSTLPPSMAWALSTQQLSMVEPLGQTDTPWPITKMWLLFHPNLQGSAIH